MSTSRVLFVDIDGTLADADGQIPPSATRCLRCVRGRGHRVFLATGRSHRDIWPEVLAVGFDGVISASGAQVNVGGLELERHHISPSQIGRFRRYVMRYGGEYCLQTPDLTYATRGALQIMRRMESDRIASGASRESLERTAFRFVQDMVPLPRHVPHPVNKITYFDAPAAPETLRRAFPDLRIDPAMGAEPGALGNGSGEVLPFGVSKGSGVRSVLRHLGVDAELSIALGDAHNDLAMFDVVGTAVAFGNASPHVRAAVALLVPTPGEDGMARALALLGLGRDDGACRSDPVHGHAVCCMATSDAAAPATLAG